MGEFAKTPRDACLICLIQASASMRDGRKSAPVASKLEAALHVVEQLVADLVQFAGSKPGNSANFEVGVLAYSTNGDSGLSLRPLLPGSAQARLLVPLNELVDLAASAGGQDRIRWAKTEPSGDAPAREALARTRELLADWIGKHSAAHPPIIVHLTDGESSDGPIASVVTSLSDAIPGAMIFHCLFRRGVAPSLYVPIPETPCGDLWAMSSPFEDDEAAQTATHPLRSLFVNKLTAAREIGRFIKKLWSRADAPTAEPVPPVGEEVAIQQVVPAEPERALEPEPPAVPAGPARFEWRALWTPKGGNAEAEWEDGYAQNAPNGVVAVADGAGDGIFSKLWADLLLDSFVARPLPLEDPAAFEPWIQDRRRAWFQAIRYPEQRWSIQAKIDRSCGAATFVALVLDPIEPGAESPSGATGWTAWAVGDACLFHIRDGQLLACFPMSASQDFGTAPSLYQSKALRPTPAAVTTRGELRPDDIIVFATDALAQRMLADVESGSPPDWGRFWNLDQEVWRGEIAALRQQNAIVNDDCTVLVLRLPVRAPEPSEEVATGHGEPEGGESYRGDVPADSATVAASVDHAQDDSLAERRELAADVDDKQAASELPSGDSRDEPHPYTEDRHE
jgi:hypothetical protein